MAPAPVNQWAVTFAQPSAFQSMPPALQSTVVALTPANSVGGGTGTPTAGNWLFCVSGWNQKGIPSATVADSDDIHTFWRPGDVTKSLWAVSAAAGNTRTSVWYAPNLARAPGDVYIAPSGAMAARSCLIVEVSGLGPWDTVTGIYTSYSAAATSLNLALGAPSAAAFLLAAACGDLSTAGQSLAPAGWTALSTVSATNGTDHTCDAVLTSACIATSGSVSVNATASSATDLSGVVIGVLQNAPSPIPAGANTKWAGRVILEMAFGSGYQTAPDQQTWSVVNDSAWAPGQGNKRFWSMSDSSSVPYGLGQYQSSSGSIQLDNIDGALSPARVASSGPWSFTATGTPSAGTYFTCTTAQSANVAVGQGFTDSLNPGILFTVTNVGTPSGGLVNVTFTPAAGTVMASPDTLSQVNPLIGTPARLRCALGTNKGVTANRWYTLGRYASGFPEKRNTAYHPFIAMGTTDIWSVASGNCPSAYRGEIRQDTPQSWWAIDDQPLAGGVQPASLRNIALGNTNPLDIIASPGGVTATNVYSTTGVSITGTSAGQVPPSVAVAAAGALQGWMYGDPQSSLASQVSSGPVTASPGAAAWQQTGLQGNTGSQGWFLAARDSSFPPLASGATVKIWFNAASFGTAAGTEISTVYYNVAGQPYAPVTLAALTTDTAPVAVLQLDTTTGNLNLITYNGSTPTTHSIYTTSDLRTGSWHCVDLALTTTTWTVLVNGGLTANVSGTATGMTSAWTWLTLNGDYGTAGGNIPADIVHGGNVAYSHATVFPAVLPAWRLLSHYAAAITGFGLLPAPQTVALATVNNEFATGLTPDGSLHDGSYGVVGGSVANYTFSGLVSAQAGAYTSGPSARAVEAGIGKDNSGVKTGDAVWVSWTGLAPAFTVYTAASANAETAAAVACGPGDSFSAGYGSGATGAGKWQTSAGSGASPPTAASALGDTVAQRIERLAGYGGNTYPGRAIDSTASLQVHAALDIGGQSSGQNIQNIVDSDNGALFCDNNGTFCYRSRPHLNADTVTWYIGMNVIAGMIPFGGDIAWNTDAQRIWDAITVTPYSPDGATPPVITPANAALANSAQQQYGPRPKPVTSYLQSASEQQNQANWLLATFGSQQRRGDLIAVDAGLHPAAWEMVLGLNLYDIVQVYDEPLGSPSTTATYRVSSVSRSIGYGANQSTIGARMILVCEPLPAGGYWS